MGALERVHVPAAGPTHESTVLEKLSRRLAWLSMALAGYAFLGGLISFAGWALDKPRLTSWKSGGISIQPNTALAVVCAGVGTLLLARNRRRASAILGAVVALIGGTVILEYLSGVDFGIDTLFMFGRTWGQTGVLYTGRMGPPGSISWTLIGITLLLASRGPKARAAVPALSLTIIGIALLSLIGYLYGADPLYALPRVTVIALQTSTFIFSLSLALLLSVQERAPTRWLVEESAAGTLVRFAVPALLILPIVLGYARLQGQRANLYDLEFGTAIRTLAEIVLLLGLLGWTARAITRQTRRILEREKLARANDERLAGILGSMNDTFVTLDKNWRLTFVNPQGLRTSRLSRADLVGKSIWELFPAAVGKHAYMQMHRAMSERVSVEFEGFYEPWKQWFSGKAYPMGDGGLAIFARDVTERKGIDESLRASQERVARDLAAMTRLQALSTRLVQAGDLHSLLRQILAAAAEFTGTEKGNIQLYDPLTRRLRILVHQGFGDRFLDRFLDQGFPVVCDAAARQLKRVICEDVSQVQGLRDTEDLDVLLKDGIRAIQSTPLISRDGRLLGLLNNHFTTPHRPAEHELRYLDLLARMTADFIERSQIEKELRESAQSLRDRDVERARLLESERGARRDAERASQIKDEFLATLSHELRSPLNAILGWVRLLERHPSDPAMLREGIDVISRNAKAQADLIADLLDMNRIISGKMRLEVTDVNLLEVVNEALDAIRPAAESKQVILKTELQEVEDPIRGDGSRLLQVMWNLLSNAVKFTPKGGEIHVRLAKIGNQAEIVVSDTGAGISPDFLPHLFERFRQADASVTRMHGGLGLGLAIVKQLVELHGGTVRAESEGPAKGAKFSIHLPLALIKEPSTEPHAETDPAAGKEKPSSGGRVDLQGITVLSVEDHADARDLLRIVLEDCHAKVISAGSVEEAMKLLEKAKPDIILCDIGMTGKDGYQFIEEVRERGVRTPALAVTAFARTEDKARALRAGYHGHIAKPIEPAELVSTVAVFAKSLKDAGEELGSKPR
jgi:PAS domain S-box-containing protein